MMCFLFECDSVVEVRNSCVASRKENTRLLHSGTNTGKLWRQQNILLPRQ